MEASGDGVHEVFLRNEPTVAFRVGGRIELWIFRHDCQALGTDVKMVDAAEGWDGTF